MTNIYLLDFFFFLYLNCLCTVCPCVEVTGSAHSDNGDSFAVAKANGWSPAVPFEGAGGRLSTTELNGMN